MMPGADVNASKKPSVIYEAKYLVPWLPCRGDAKTNWQCLLDRLWVACDLVTYVMHRIQLMHQWHAKSTRFQSSVHSLGLSTQLRGILAERLGRCMLSLCKVLC